MQDRKGDEMKEITRVHIAKQVYDIELDAKRKFESYIKELEQYAGDAEILADIEIRITELLAEMGVERGGVIVAQEVAKVRERLGEPVDFASEDTVDPQGGLTDQLVKRLYRDMDGALVGGVLNGIATFSKIDVVWVRLAFIILLFASFGAALLVYVVLWIVVPPARTVADKLQLVGKPVTLASMREQINSEETPTRGAKILKSILLIGGGVVSILVAIVALVTTLGATGVFLISDQAQQFLIGMSSYAWMAWVAMGLFVLAGLSLSVLASLVAVMLFRGQATRRMIIASIALVILGIISASGGGAMLAGGLELRLHEAQSAIQTHKEALPEMSGVTKLAAQAYSGSGTVYNDADEMTIKYVVTTGVPRYELTTQFNSKPDIRVEGDTVRITLKSVGRQVFDYGYGQPELVVYGPALEEIDVSQGSLQYVGSEQQKQEVLQISSLNAVGVTVFGSYENLLVQKGGNVDVSMSTVRNLSVDLQGGLTSVQAGVVYDLVVNYPDVCPIQATEDDRPTVSVHSVSSGEITYNGVTGPVMQRQTPCGSVQIGQLAL